MRLINRLFPALAYLDPASEVAFRHYLVDSARQATKRLALICASLMLFFSATDILLGDSWASLNNSTRYLAATCISVYLVYSARLEGEQWLQGWLAINTVTEYHVLWRRSVLWPARRRRPYGGSVCHCCYTHFSFTAENSSVGPPT